MLAAGKANSVAILIFFDAGELGAGRKPDLLPRAVPVFDLWIDRNRRNARDTGIFRLPFYEYPAHGRLQIMLESVSCGPPVFPACGDSAAAVVVLWSCRQADHFQRPRGCQPRGFLFLDSAGRPKAVDS